MTVTLAKTEKKYHGRKAETYEAVRTKQQRWRLENEIVERMVLELKPKSVLDVPVGTGRYLPLYKRAGVQMVTGVDISDEMLALAKRKTGLKGAALRLMNANVLTVDVVPHDISVCVRFLDLMEEASMLSVLRRLASLSKRAIILTIRLGDTYVAKSNTATHSNAKFSTAVKRLGWRVAETVPIFDQGWVVIQLQRRT